MTELMQRDGDGGQRRLHLAGDEAGLGDRETALAVRRQPRDLQAILAGARVAVVVDVVDVALARVEPHSAGVEPPSFSQRSTSSCALLLVGFMSFSS